MNLETKSDPLLQPGLNAEASITVREAETAIALGSGTVPVYATPALVALMENAAVRALEGHLPAGHTTVGVHIDVQHLAATPTGMQVRARAELVEVQGRKLSFRIQAWDEVEQIGEASHVRYLVSEETFMTKVSAKGR